MSTTWVLIPWSIIKHYSMTYAELLDELQQLSPEQLKQNVTLYSIAEDEFVPAYMPDVTDSEEQVLDPNHFVITF